MDDFGEFALCALFLMAVRVSALWSSPSAVCRRRGTAAFAVMILVEVFGCEEVISVSERINKKKKM